MIHQMFNMSQNMTPPSNWTNKIFHANNDYISSVPWSNRPAGTIFTRLIWHILLWGVVISWFINSLYIRRGEKKQNQRVGSHLVCPHWHRGPAEQTDDIRVRVRLLTPLTAAGWDFSTFMFCGFPFYATETWAHISNKSTCVCVWAGYKVHTGSV